MDDVVQYIVDGAPNINMRPSATTSVSCASINCGNTGPAPGEIAGQYRQSQIPSAQVHSNLSAKSSTVFGSANVRCVNAVSQSGLRHLLCLHEEGHHQLMGGFPTPTFTANAPTRSSSTAIFLYAVAGSWPGSFQRSWRWRGSTVQTKNRRCATHRSAVHYSAHRTRHKKCLNVSFLVHCGFPFTVATSLCHDNLQARAGCRHTRKDMLE